VTRRWLVPGAAAVAIGVSAYVATLIATPFVLMRIAEARVGAQAGVNHFAFGPMTTAQNQTIIRPSPDLSYSICVFQIPEEGYVLIEVAPVPGHYWSVSVFDARTDAAAVRTDRDTGGKAAKLVIHRRPTSGQAHLGYDTAPEGYEPVPVDYDRGIVLIRILLNDKSEFAVIDAVRRKSSCAAAT
jgi:uncharacterized membrane protein